LASHFHDARRDDKYAFHHIINATFHRKEISQHRHALKPRVAAGLFFIHLQKKPPDEETLAFLHERLCGEGGSLHGGNRSDLFCSEIAIFDFDLKVNALFAAIERDMRDRPGLSPVLTLNKLLTYWPVEFT
jgi:hypothetical protein